MSDAALLDASASASAPRDRRWNGPLELLPEELEPISRAAGFDWRTNIALIGGFAAKEVVLGVLGTAYSLENTDEENYLSLSEQLAKRSDWNPVRAFALMVFVMLYAPCLVTIAVIRRESGSWKWAAFSTLYSTTFAFVLAVIVYQVGMLIAPHL